MASRTRPASETNKNEATDGLGDTTSGARDTTGDGG
jgi:hypothetical protein